MGLPLDGTALGIAARRANLRTCKRRETGRKFWWGFHTDCMRGRGCGQGCKVYHSVKQDFPKQLCSSMRTCETGVKQEGEFVEMVEGGVGAFGVVWSCRFCFVNNYLPGDRGKPRQRQFLKKKKTLSYTLFKCRKKEPHHHHRHHTRSKSQTYYLVRSHDCACSKNEMHNFAPQLQYGERSFTI